MAAKRTWDSNLSQPVDVLTVSKKRLRTLRVAAGLLQVEHTDATRVSSEIPERNAMSIGHDTRSRYFRRPHFSTDETDITGDFLTLFGMLAPALLEITRVVGL